ncbi:MAG: hypothetical protein OEY06_12150 [Gammaproteobacteria bacterium]|nr:hypothetical protein [Gammaproteobacteria bacterium]
MKRLLIIVTLLITPFTSINANDTKGHVAFFILLSENSQDYVEINEDFNYYYENLSAWLVENKYTYSRHTTAPITIKGILKPFTKQMLVTDIGVILIKNEHTYKIIQSIGTDIDLIMDINSFY